MSGAEMSKYERRGWSIPYFAFPPLSAMLIGAIWLFGQHGFASAVLIVVASLLIAEGAVLIADWQGSADEFPERASRTRNDAQSSLWWVDTWHVRLIVGGGLLVIGAIVLSEGIRYL